MAQNLSNDRTGGEGRDEAQGALLTTRAALHVEGKDPLEQPGPPPALCLAQKTNQSFDKDTVRDHN